ncbi:MAG: hypothetical protein GY811_26915, partial [Myxococcales bacterium]|nr:hypothetical protein [Myxococcales bacterium]
MSAILDAHPQASSLVLVDLNAGVINPKRGANGLSGEQVLRIAIIKQANGCSSFVRWRARVGPHP